MYCIDTNIFVEFLRGNKEIINKFNNTSSNDIFISPITLCELYQGVYLSNKIGLNIQELNEFIDDFSILDFNKKISEEFGKEFARLKKIGKQIPEFDLIIACFAKVNNLVLVTRDKNHFVNTGVEVEVW
jgi:tRNA(fMet)-specific endonuclease VapC